MCRMGLFFSLGGRMPLLDFSFSVVELVETLPVRSGWVDSASRTFFVQDGDFLSLREGLGFVFFTPFFYRLVAFDDVLRL